MTARKEHPHAWVLRELADGAPPSDFEVQGNTDSWFTFEHADILTAPDYWKVRRKQKMHRIGEHTFPAPMTEAPKEGTCSNCTGRASMKLTPWFDGSIKPVRAGVYETLHGRSGYAYFNGKRWGWCNATVEQASKYRDTNGAEQRKPWRGLAEDPNK